MRDLRTHPGEALASRLRAVSRRSFLHGTVALPAAAFLPEVRATLQQLAQQLSDLSGEPLWQRVRAEFALRPGLTHLNTATIGSTPRRVIEAFTRFLWEIESDPQTQVFGAPSHRMEDVRAKAAAFLGAGPDEVVLTRNTTEGMNMIATGLNLQPGDQVLTTNHEHPGGHVCWEHLAEHAGIELVEIQMPAPVRDRQQILELVESHLTPRTRVCSFSHVGTVTGLRMPLAQIATITRPRDILLVCDGAQAPGMLAVDVAALGVDTYASSSHKWMLAPKGCGLLYIRKDVQDRVRPLFLRSGYQVYTASSGTRNVATILAHGAAMDFQNAIGRARVERRCTQLRHRLRQRLAQIDGLSFLTPEQDELAGGILSIALQRGKHREIRQRLYSEFGLVVKTGKAEYNALRFSTHIYNNDADIERLGTALEKIL